MRVLKSRARDPLSLLCTQYITVLSFRLCMQAEAHAGCTPMHRAAHTSRWVTSEDVTKSKAETDGYQSRLGQYEMDVEYILLLLLVLLLYHPPLPHPIFSLKMECNLIWPSLETGDGAQQLTFQFRSSSQSCNSTSRLCHQLLYYFWYTPVIKPRALIPGTFWV